MILICGIEVDSASLPFADVLEYKVSSDPFGMTIALKTIARSEACVKVYLSSGVKIDEPILKPISDKVVHFGDEKELRRLLDNSPSNEVVEESSTDVEEPVEQMVIKSSNDGGHSEEPKLTTVSANSVVGEVKEVSMSLPKIFMQIPESIDDDEDSLKQLLRTKDGIIEQQKIQLKEYDALLKQVYEEDEKVIHDVKEAYDKKLDEATVAFNTVKKKLEDELNTGYGRYKVYGQYHHAYLQEGLSADEKAELPSNISNIEVIACGGGQSLYRMFDMVGKNMTDSKKPYVFIDLTGDYVSTLHYKCKDVALLLKEHMTPEIEKTFTEGCRKVANSVIVSCEPFHDIALLGINWGTFINNIHSLFGEQVRVFILLNSIQSFAVEYTFAKLATVLKSYVFVKSSPVLIKYLYGKLNTIPSSRQVKWLVSDYFAAAKDMLEAVAEKYSVVTNGELLSLDTV